MITNTTYGTWCTTVDHYSTSLEQSVYTALGDYADDYDLDAIHAEYREAINAALPDGVTLAGDQFYGPYYPADRAWDGELDIKEIVQGIDFWAIAAKHDTTA